MPEQTVWRQEFEPTRIRTEQLLVMVDVQDIPLPAEFKTTLPAHLLKLEPGGWGGNHRHLSREVYVALNEGLYLIWRDATGKRHEVAMAPTKDGKLQVFAMPPYVPHLIENRGRQDAFVYELLELNNGPLEPLEGLASLR
jgi:uncharacterized RmlC-like cupin family protein